MNKMQTELTILICRPHQQSSSSWPQAIKEELCHVGTPRESSIGVSTPLFLSLVVSLLFGLFLLFITLIYHTWRKQHRAAGGSHLRLREGSKAGQHIAT